MGQLVVQQVGHAYWMVTTVGRVALPLAREEIGCLSEPSLGGKSAAKPSIKFLMAEGSETIIKWGA